MKNCLSRAGKRALLGLAVGCGILLAGCHKEPGPGNPKDGTITVRLSPGAAREIVVKSIGENNFDPNGIASVYAIQLDGGGNVLTDKDDSNKKLIDWYSSDQLAAAGNEQKTIRIKIDSRAEEIYFIANANANGFNNVKDKEAIEAVKKNLKVESSLCELIDGKNYLPMAGVLKIGETSDYAVALYRAAAKLDLTIKAQPLDGNPDDAFALKSVQIKQVPTSLQYFRHTNEIEQATTYPDVSSDKEVMDYEAIRYYPEQVGGTVPDGSVDLADAWKDQASYMPANCIGKIIDNNATGTEKLEWYLPENARGTYPSSSGKQWDKQEVKYATYVKIVGYYRQNGLVDEVTYRVWLGKDNHSDYNILRNRKYVLTATIRDKNRADVRVDDLYESINYLDYTDNSQPLSVIGAVANDSKDWNEDALSADKGWDIPGKKDLMLSWIYLSTEKSFREGESAHWVKEHEAPNGQVTGRWAVNLGNGETLFNTSGGTAKFRSYQVWKQKPTYPYVETGTNIIVSRDENGGVKEEHIRMTSTTTVDGRAWNWNTQGTPTHTDQDEANIVAARFEVAPVAVTQTFKDRKNWNEAVRSCEDLNNNSTNADPKKGWRLPTQRELMLMYYLNDNLADGLKTSTDNHGDYDPSDQDEDGYHIFYWSATNDNSQSTSDIVNYAWSVCTCTGDDVYHFQKNGKTEGYLKTNVNFVRCVRDAMEDE